MPQTLLSTLSRAERLSIAGTYSLTLLENLCMLAYPAITGWAVDGLLKGSYRGLSALIAVWLVHLITAFVRQRFDTRVFMGLYARLAVRTVAEQQRLGHGTSIVSARVEMMRDMVGFFEADVPAMFSQVVTVVGSLVMLFTYDLQAGLIAMAVLLPMGLVNAWYWRRALRLHRGLNDQIEREIEDIEAARPLRLRRHFGRVRRWHVQLSDSESWTWTVTELATIVALVVLLIDFTRSASFSAGAIYAVLAYVFDYLEGLDSAPALVNNVARLRDIRARLGNAEAVD
ncbi:MULTISPECIES: ABC transporter six-transmembrane domain-containing protein [unclassified Synechococcus]|uniref:ABC transporter six-transmembrane domain-containing protein n=1 Tax=unclassified Synechococcus TaxID=2626047 RepID=UPI001C24BC67|nr:MULTISPECIES: ABC transporter six-transmembrane domain-containing protein [unclassified Synechococcus]